MKSPIATYFLVDGWQSACFRQLAEIIDGGFGGAQFMRLLCSV